METLIGSFILITTSVILLYKLYQYKHRRYNELINKIPLHPHYVFYYIYLIFKYYLKSGYDFSKAYYDMFHDVAKDYQDGKYGNNSENIGILRISFWPFAPPMIIIGTPSYYKDILEDKDNIFKNISYQLLIGLIGKRNLIMSGGDVWRHDRKIVNQSFKYSNILKLNSTIFNKSNDFMETIELNKFNIKNLHPILASTCTHIILEAAIGKNIHINDSNLIDYIQGQIMYSKSLIIQVAFPFFFFFPPLFNYTLGYQTHLAVKRIRRFITGAVNERIEIIKKRRSTDSNHNEDADGDANDEGDAACLTDTLIDAHLNNPKEMPRDAIIDQVITFVFVGHKATSYTLNAILFLLAAHPEKQEKLCQEIDAIINADANVGTNLKTDANPFNIETLNKMTYLNAVIKEGQRMYPISASIGRKVTKEFKCHDYTIPVGAEIFFDFNTLTKRPESFAYKPNDFIPERFIPNDEGWDANRSSFAFIPFSHGLRKCIGEKFAMNILKILIVKILLKFNISTSLTMDDIVMVQDIMAYIRTPIDITFSERTNGNGNTFLH